MASDATEQKERKLRGPRGSYKTSISPRTLVALEALASGAAETLVDAARIAGLTPRAIAYAVQKPKIREWLRNHVQATFAAGQLAASRTMLALLRSDNSISQFRAAAWICGVNGVAPVETRSPLVSINFGESPGYVIDLSHSGDDGRTIDERGVVVPFRTMKDITPPPGRDDD